jgi:hypothetical protein
VADRPVRYPLAKLAEIRALRATGAAIDLAAALAGETEAEQAAADARAAVDAARGAARAVTLTGETPLAAWQVAQREAYAIRLRRDVQRAEDRLATYETELAEWRSAVAAARDQSTSARADQKVVELHRDRWETAAKKKRERRED